MINLENYEVYIIDYLDGKLTSSEVDELLLFLDLHPTIKDDFYAISQANLQVIDNCETYPDKEKLKKVYEGDINQNNISDFLISKIENNLNQNQTKELENYISFFPEAKKELIFFENTRVKPNLALKFPDKDLLYKKEISIVFYLNRISIAALILIAIGFAFSLFRAEKNNSSTLQIATSAESKKLNNKGSLSKSIKSTSSFSEVKTEVFSAKPKSINAKIKNSNTLPFLNKSNRILRQNFSIIESQIAYEIVVPINIADFVPLKDQENLSIPSLNKTDEQVQEQNNFMSPQELLFASIKSVARKSKQTNNSKDNNYKLSGSDLAAIVATGINEIAGTEIKIIDNEDSKGIAFGNNESYELGKIR
jgi:hypothetical protein